MSREFSSISYIRRKYRIPATQKCYPLKWIYLNYLRIYDLSQFNVKYKTIISERPLLEFYTGRILLEIFEIDSKGFCLRAVTEFMMS